MSDFWQTLFRAVDTKLNISTSYRPQQDGQTERVNETWEQVIRCYVHPLHDDKVQHLTNVEFAINASVSTSTTMSPFKATLGFEPTSPTTATFKDNEPSRTLPEQVKILVEMHKLAHDSVKATQAHMQKVANRHRLPIAFLKCRKRAYFVHAKMTSRANYQPRVTDRLHAPKYVVSTLQRP
jgi:hypothetical protein